MSDKYLVIVAGATGKQGTSVIHALLAHGGYTVRGLTRDSTSAASLALTAKGAELLQLSLSDREGLISAFKGAYAVFGYSMPTPESSDLEQGKNLVDACVANSVPLFVWSSLPSAEKLSGGKVRIPIHDDKAAVEDYIKEVHQPAVVLWTGSFTENMLNFAQLQQPTPGHWEIQFPVAPPTQLIPFSYITKDMGPVVLAMIEHWEKEEWRNRLGKEPVIMCSYEMKGSEMAEVVARVTGKHVAYSPAKESLPGWTRELYEFFMEYCHYPEPIPPKVLTDMGVEFPYTGGVCERGGAPLDGGERKGAEVVPEGCGGMRGIE